MTAAAAPAAEHELVDAARRLTEVGRNLVPADASRLGQLTFLGYGNEQINRHLLAYEPRVRQSLCNLRSGVSFTDVAQTYAPSRQTERRGVRMWAAVPEVHLQAHPLVGLQEPHLVAAPVLMSLIVLDGTLAVIPGQPHRSGDQTAWATTDPQVVGTARRLVAATRAASRAPVIPAGPPGDRQLVVARLVLRGAKNATIARHLGVSERTVGADIGRLARYHDVRGRAELVSRLGGPLDPRTPLAELST